VNVIIIYMIRGGHIFQSIGAGYLGSNHHSLLQVSAGGGARVVAYHTIN
jgi:hypothetical protein